MAEKKLQVPASAMEALRSGLNAHGHPRRAAVMAMGAPAQQEEKAFNGTAYPVYVLGLEELVTLRAARRASWRFANLNCTAEVHEVGGVHRFASYSDRPDSSTEVLNLSVIRDAIESSETEVRRLRIAALGLEAFWLHSERDSVVVVRALDGRIPRLTVMPENDFLRYARLARESVTKFNDAPTGVTRIPDDTD